MQKYFQMKKKKTKSQCNSNYSAIITRVSNISLTATKECKSGGMSKQYQKGKKKKAKERKEEEKEEREEEEKREEEEREGEEEEQGEEVLGCPASRF